MINLMKYKIKINTLENELETLRNTMKSELYEDLLDKSTYVARCQKLTEQNKKLRKEVKKLKEKVLEGK